MLAGVGEQSHEVNAVPKMSDNQNYETLVVTVDSGAYNAVGPPAVGAYFNVEPTKASQSGQGYSAANGSAIISYGQRVVKVVHKNGNNVRVYQFNLRM